MAIANESSTVLRLASLIDAGMITIPLSEYWTMSAKTLDMLERVIAIRRKPKDG